MIYATGEQIISHSIVNEVKSKAHQNISGHVLPNDIRTYTLCCVIDVQS